MIDEFIKKQQENFKEQQDNMLDLGIKLGYYSQLVKRDANAKFNYQTGFFTRFASADDMRKNAKAVVLQLIGGAYLTIEATLKATYRAFLSLGQLTLGILTFNIDDFSDSWKNVKKACSQLLNACYVAVVTVVNCLDAAARFVTHSLTSILGGAADLGKGFGERVNRASSVSRVEQPPFNPSVLPSSPGAAAKQTEQYVSSSSSSSSMSYS